MNAICERNLFMFHIFLLAESSNQDNDDSDDDDVIETVKYAYQLQEVICNKRS